MTIEHPADISEARDWLNAHKVADGLSWPDLEKRIGRAAGTLSAFGVDKYDGRQGPIADAVMRYRRTLNEQLELLSTVPAVPEWYETETSRRLRQLLQWGQRGRIVLMVGAPGIGKTTTALRYQMEVSNVWVATMSPATAGVSTMSATIAREIRIEPKVGSPMGLYDAICAAVAGKNGLLVIDEAHELTEKAINQLRAIHDKTKVGIVLIGNEDVVGRISDPRKLALAQLKSRVAVQRIQRQLEPADVDAMLAAWNITDQGAADAVREIANRMGDGALRTATFVVENAYMAAFGAGEALSAKHVRAAASARRAEIGVRI